MKWWPFGKDNKQAQQRVPQVEEPSAMDRLLAKNCNRDEFILLYVRMLQEHMPDSTVQMTGETVVRIIRTNGKESTNFIDNAWISYSQNSEGRRETLERYMKVASGLEESSGPLSPERIVAMIKDSRYISLFKPSDDAMVQHLCGDLWVAYVEDLPDRMRSLKRQEVMESGVTEKDLHHLAKENLRRIMPALERHGDGPWYLLTAGGDYTASLLLFDGIWDELANLVEGELVAIVPSRDVLMFTGTQPKEGLAAIRERAAEIAATGSYLISETLIARSGGQWTVFNVN
jgi:uncharacterized protein YtpQ (UPF0354 family)